MHVNFLTADEGTCRMARVYFLTGYLLAVSASTLSAQEALIVSFQSTVNNNGSLYTYRGTVEQLSRQSSILPIVTSFSLTGVAITSLTSDPDNDVLFFYDYFTQAIYQMSEFTSSSVRQTKMLQSVSSSINTNIAFDWITRNLYCTDGHLGWIFVINLAGASDMRRILLDTNMESPKAITVDPTAGFMFWSDNYKGTTRIERADLSGELRQVIVSTSLLSIGDISADVQEKRIYWTDRIRNTIERCMYDGRQREIIHRRNNNFFSKIMTDRVHICVTEDYQDAMICMYKSSSEDVISEKYDRHPYGLEIFDSSRKPSATDKCASKTCQHFCAPTPTGATCLCKNGYTLQGDGTSCTADHNVPVKGLLLGNTTHVCVIDLMNLMTSLPKPHSCLLENLNDLNFLSVDVRTLDVFYVDTGTNSLNSVNLQTGSTVSLTSTGLVSGLAYDWFGRNLYWTEKDTRKIRLVTVATRSSSDLGTSTLSPSDVTVDPHGRMIYWISGPGTSRNTIQAISTNGNMAQSDIVSTGNSLTALYYDTLGNRLYWVEDGALKSSLGSGSDITVHTTLAAQYHSQLLVYKMYVVWISSASSQFQTMSMENNQLQTLEVDGFGDITGMALFDKSMQTLEPEPCSLLNGGCSQVCIPTSDTERRCACTFGFTLQPDQTSCKSKQALTNNFLLVPDLNHARLYQISIDTVSPEILALDIQVDRPVDAVYDPVNQFIYWTEANLNAIKRAKPDGSQVLTLLTFSQEYPERLAIDFGTGNVFYTTSAVGDTSERDGKLGVLRTTHDNVYNKVLVKDEGAADYVQGLLVYPKKGFLIWSVTDFDSTNIVGAIYKSFMDGSAVTVLVSDVNSPQGLSMDYTTERVYWSSYDGIGYTDLFGNQGTVLQSSKALTDLVVSSNVIYYTGRNTRNVVKINKTTGTNIHWLENTPEVGNVISLDIYTEQQQQANTDCANNGLCEVFCLPSHLGKSCACQDGVYLQPDGRTCGSSVRCEAKIPNGLVSSFCTGVVGETCAYECNSGYHKNTEHSTITCLSVGTWTTVRTNLCLVDSTATTVSNLPVIVGAVLVVALIVSIVVIVVCVWKRKRKLQNYQDSMYLSSINNMNTPTVVQNQYGMTHDSPGAVGPQVVVTPSAEKNKINPAYLYPPERRARCPSPDHVYAELPPAYSQTDPNYINPMGNEEEEDDHPNPYVDPELIADNDSYKQLQEERKKRRSLLENSLKSNSSYHQSNSSTMDNDGRTHDNPYFLPVHETTSSNSEQYESDHPNNQNTPGENFEPYQIQKNINSGEPYLPYERSQSNQRRSSSDSLPEINTPPSQ